MAQWVEGIAADLERFRALIDGDNVTKQPWDEAQFKRDDYSCNPDTKFAYPGSAISGNPGAEYFNPATALYKQCMRSKGYTDR